MSQLPRMKSRRPSKWVVVILLPDGVGGLGVAEALPLGATKAITDTATIAAESATDET